MKCIPYALQIYINYLCKSKRHKRLVHTKDNNDNDKDIVLKIQNLKEAVESTSEL